MSDLDSRDLADLLNEALPLWAEVTDTRPGSGTIRIRPLARSWIQSDLELRKALDDLNESRILDPTGATTSLILRGMIDGFLHDIQVPWEEILRNPAFHARLASVRRLVDLTSASACVDAVMHAQSAHRAALRAHIPRVDRGEDENESKSDADPVDAFIANEHALGNVRLVAARSIDTLNTHQMTRGIRSGRRLQLNQFVHVFESPSAFLGAIARTLDASVSLALIQPSSTKLTSYFAIGVRDGEVLHLLTDLERSSHPDFRSMTRRPDRDVERRSRSHLLPYRLLDEMGKIEDSKRTASDDLRGDLVPALGARVLGHLSVLSPQEITWLLMVADLIADRSASGELERNQLSHLGDAIHAAAAEVRLENARSSDQSLIDQRAENTMGGVARHALDRLADVSIDGSTPEAAGSEIQIGHNAWLETRYRDQVPRTATDVLSPDRVSAAARVLDRGSASVDDDLDEGVDFQDELDGAGKMQLRTLPGDSIGSLDEIRADAHFRARQNITQVVARLARTDFDRDRDEVLRWYTARVASNPEVMRAIVRGSWVLPSCAYKSQIPSMNDPFPRPDQLVWENRDAMRTYMRQGKWEYRADGDGYLTMEGVRILRLDLGSRSNGYCLIGKKDADGIQCRPCDEASRRRQASIVFEINPDNHLAIAAVAGVGDSDLPWQLRHWTMSEPYVGNSILGRIDPIELIVDPWNQLGMRVIVGLCKPCLSSLRKTLATQQETKCNPIS